MGVPAPLSATYPRGGSGRQIPAPPASSDDGDPARVSGWSCGVPAGGSSAPSAAAASAAAAAATPIAAAAADTR